MKSLKYLITGALITGAAFAGEACSRVVYIGEGNNIIMVGRTLDWRTPIPTNIYVYPQGIKKQSMPEGPMLTWTSKYGSVLAVGYDGGITEGMNEAGLSMNGLFCKGTIYSTEAPEDKTLPVMSLSVFISYFLDNFATVDEVETWLDTNRFAIARQTFDGGTVSTLHWALTDRTGTTLVMEYTDGQLSTYKGRDLRVLTNDPTLPKMQEIEKYWEQIGGTNMLPGTVRSSDRFVRASYFIRHVPDNFSYSSAYAAISSIMGVVSVPYGYEVEGSPNLSSTQWRSISDITGGKYYFKFADATADFWVDLGRLRLNPGAPVLKLDTTDHSDFYGCINNRLKESAPFTPMW